MGTLSCGRSPPIYRDIVYVILIKILIIISLSNNIYKPYMYEHLGSYISLVNNSIDPIQLYWLKFINHLH